MEGYLSIRIQPWLGRLITRLVAIIPAMIVILVLWWKWNRSMLILSQVILSLQLGFAIIPLIHFVSDKKKVWGFAIKLWVKIASWLIALTIVKPEYKVGDWRNSREELMGAEIHPLLVWLVVFLCLGCFGRLLYLTIKPLLEGNSCYGTHTDNLRHCKCILYLDSGVLL